MVVGYIRRKNFLGGGKGGGNFLKVLLLFLFFFLLPGFFFLLSITLSFVFSFLLRFKRDALFEAAVWSLLCVCVCVCVRVQGSPKIPIIAQCGKMLQILPHSKTLVLLVKNKNNEQTRVQ